MSDILFIQPYDKSDFRRPGRRTKMSISRAQFEVAYQIPQEYSMSFLDLNIALQCGQSLEYVVANALLKKPKLVFLTFPTFVQGGQIERILVTIRGVSSVSVVIGGAALSLIRDDPLFWWPELHISACYNGFGVEIPEIIAACLTNNRPRIDGVYWEWANNRNKRGKTRLVDGYLADDFYSAKGRLDFSKYLVAIRKSGLRPTALLEMVRGCKNRCNFCAINRSFGCYSRNPETVLKEAEFLVKAGVDYFHIVDPTFCLLKERSCLLLNLLKEFHRHFPRASFEILTRPEFVTGKMADAFKEAGIVRCDVGMETMTSAELKKTHKNLAQNSVWRAVKRLSERGIETKLFHILFPNNFSVETVRFLTDLKSKGMKFILQSSFLRRKRPVYLGGSDFLAQDRTIVSDEDTIAQLMEYMAVNCAFPSMDLGKNGDSFLQERLKRHLDRGSDLRELFDITNFPDEVIFCDRFIYQHREGLSVNYCIERMKGGEKMDKKGQKKRKNQKKNEGRKERKEKKDEEERMELTKKKDERDERWE